MIKFTPIALMFLLLGACAGGPRLEAMVPDVATNAVITENSSLWKSTGIGEIAGSTKTNKLWKTQITNEVFAKALRQSLGLHAVLSEGDGNYKVSVKLKELRQPFLGIELAVTARVKYTVTRTSDNFIVFNRMITETYISTLKDSYVFSDRLKLANEGAIKDNIKKFIGAYIAESRNFPETFYTPPSS